MTRSLAACFRDAREPLFVEHSLYQLLAQRVLGLAAGYEDLNDHNTLRRDPLFALAANKSDPLGLDRRCEQDKGNALASASTLNRLELNNKTSRAHKIQADHAQIETLLIRKGVGTLDKKTREVVIDLDATDDPLHGSQEGRFFHGYYGNYCYLPLYAFIGEAPVWPSCALARTMLARVRCVPCSYRRPDSPALPARPDHRAGTAVLPPGADGGVKNSRPVYYRFGLARNSRLLEELEEAFFRARAKACLTGGVAREFVGFFAQRPEKVQSKITG